MSELIKKFRLVKKKHLLVAGILLLFVLASTLLIVDESEFSQSESALVAQVYFDGEYSVAGGPWQKIVKGEHIPATEGDVTLRGNFHILTPDGEYVGICSSDALIAFYLNHINITVCEAGNEPFVLDLEDRMYGNTLCGVSWVAYYLTGTTEEPLEIIVHNPHGFGNETAIDEMLDNVSFWTEIGFEKDILASGERQRNAGIVLMLVSLMFLGTALFSTLIHIKNSRIIWLLGLLVLFAGLYFTYSSKGISFWSDSIASNTALLGVSMMFYMLFLSMIIVCLMKGTKKVGAIAVGVLSVANAICFVLPKLSSVFFYDTLIWWIFVQLAINVVLGVCLIQEIVISDNRERLIYIGAFLPLVAFAVDVLGNWRGAWRGAIVSQYVFLVLFAISVVMVLKLIPSNINAAAKAKTLEMEKIALNAELTQSRMSTMMSQIRPHFIYNTLGTIEQLCDIDPTKAGELVHDFAKYLRGNFGELDNPKPILMSQEMAHVHHYVSIENVRFPDMTFTFEMNSEDFRIPALTVQPIVENAIKHGLMKLQKGGTIHVVSYETDTHYCVSVVDDGVGFDATVMHDERKHVGLRNIRERLSAMVNGTMEIESEVGVGTKVLIKIPKEAK